MKWEVTWMMEMENGGTRVIGWYEDVKEKLGVGDIK